MNKQNRQILTQVSDEDTVFLIVKICENRQKFRKSFEAVSSVNNYVRENLCL